MNDIGSYRIIPSEPQTELQQFASWFHQDYELLFSNFYEGADMYLRSITLERKKVLGQELKQFIKDNQNSEREEIIEAWCGLGAQAWQEDLEVLPVLNDFVWMTEK